MASSDGGKKVRTARKIVALIDETVSFAVLVVLVLMLGFGCYCLWDSKQVYAAADAADYEVYKPGKDSLSFDELRKLNPDVFGWLTVYGTSIDYPLVQGKDNLVYLNTDAKGSYCLSGSIFLDSRNAKDFSDYNSIIHGHHMAASAMFGDLSKFADKSFFDGHEYGNLYVDGKNYGIEFFEYAVVDSYDKAVYTPAVEGRDAQAKYLQGLLDKAMYTRDASQLSAEHIVLLSTCSSDITNGRSILAGCLTDKVYKNQFSKGGSAAGTVADSLSDAKARLDFIKLPLWITMLLILALLIIIYIVIGICSRRTRQKKTLRTRSCKKEG